MNLRMVLRLNFNVRNSITRRPANKSYYFRYTGNTNQYFCIRIYRSTVFPRGYPLLGTTLTTDRHRQNISAEVADGYTEATTTSRVESPTRIQASQLLFFLKARYLMKLQKKKNPRKL